MFFEAQTLDDLLWHVFQELLKRPFNVSATRGTMSEIIGAQLCLKNPRARLSHTETKGTPFSAIGELLWYLSGENKLKFIRHYISAYDEETEDKETIYGGYGPRLFNQGDKYNQVVNVIRLLKVKSSSRRAVIQIFDAKDIAKHHTEIPCTCTLQFLVREDKLEMLVYMRSNDAYLGLPHDIFCFTMLQEIIARSIKVDVGRYHHMVGSLHLYCTYQGKKNLPEQYLGEGLQTTKIPMPEMPPGDPWIAINKLLAIEKTVRKGKQLDISKEEMDEYWKDVARLLQIYSLTKSLTDPANVRRLKSEMSNSIYDQYIEKRLVSSQRKIVS